ncbi:MAG: hypothetical protein M1818_002036 [Claussenomyces sp. TS43310]|nr:MAG: hypothetical protein M1818_002036 [Claussenomyces sp. TS43310]
MAHVTTAKYAMYLTGQHNVIPEASLVANITHVLLAFMRSESFNIPNATDWPLFTSVAHVRAQFPAGTAVMVAIGGWGDTEGFSTAAKSRRSRQRFAENVRAMVDATGADGIDLDWEYPGGNGEDYKRVPNQVKRWEIEAYPALLAAVRAALGPDKLLSAAVPGLPRDMLAFTAAAMARIERSVDFLNIMAYDLMNRRDGATKHHTGLALSRRALDAYLARGLPPRKALLGLAFYIKWFRTAPDPALRRACAAHPVGCRTALLEDPDSGADLGRAGAFSYHDPVPAELAASWDRARRGARYDEEEGGGGGCYYWDADEDLWWSWDSPPAMARKVATLFGERALGGVFAWGLGEDAPDWTHLKALNEAVRDVGLGRADGEGAPSTGRGDESQRREEL